MSVSNILPHQFHTLSQQNTRLNQTLITITLNHQQLLQENRQITEQLKKKDYALIEATLREKNLDHSLKNLQAQYTKLQEQYQDIYNVVKASKKLQIRDIYKKESQLAFDMTNIERESYREAKKAKNQQINQYQQRMIELARENDQLKVKMLEITSEYNTKMHELKSVNIQNEAKLNALKSLQTRQKPQVVLGSTNSFEILKLELKLQNTKERLEFFVKENAQIKARNIELNTQVQTLLGELKQATEDNENTKEEANKQSSLFNALNKQDSSVDYITNMLEENTKLRKEIQQITQKYILLTQRYPKLIDDFQTITQLQENINKLNQVKSLQAKLSNSQQKCKSLQEFNQKLQAKLLSELKSRQSLQNKTSILTKRFNQIFIRMNPYFDIYQYESLELDQTMFKFFDEKKDYKSLKEYEGKLLGLKRELKEAEANYQAKERQLKLEIEQKNREILRINEEKNDTVKSLNQLSDANKVLKQQISNYQLLTKNKIDEQSNPSSSNPNQSLSIAKLQHQVTIPLLQQLITNLHQERQELFRAIYNKDKIIAELSQELHSTKLNQTIKTINLSSDESRNTLIQMPSVSVQFSELLKQNHELEKNYDQTVEKLQTQLTTLKQQLNNQHNLYQLQVNKYENDYETKLAQIKRMLDNWMVSSEQLRIKLQSSEQGQKNQDKQEKQNPRAQGQQEGEMIPEQPSVINQQQQPHSQHIHEANPLIRHPSHSNLQKLPLLNQQESNNKLIGQSTVQTLTQTLKKYQQDMNEVLTMCAKVSKDYSELKERVKDYEHVERNNLELMNQLANVKEELQKTKGYLSEKNLAISTLETLYKAKSSYCEQLQSTTQSSQSLLTTQLAQQQNLNQTLTKQLQQLKEKFYQLASKSSSSPAQEAALMNKGEFQTIVIMQANKNKEISNLSEKNKHLQGKLQVLMQEMNQMKVKEAEKKAQEVSPMERAEMKQLSELLQGTNVIELVKRANQIIDQQAERDRQVVQEQQQEQGQENEGIVEEPEEGEA